MEYWKSIEEFEGDYSISTTGKVASNKNNIILKTRKDRYDYEIVTLWFKSKPYTRKIHRLVAIAFIENPDDLETVNHKDGIKQNNAAENLEWKSVKENHRHAFKIGLHSIGENRKAGRAVKLTEKDVLEIRELITANYSNTEIGRMYSVSCGCIYSIRVGKSWKHI
jgi:hypothetical protein